MADKIALTREEQLQQQLDRLKAAKARAKALLEQPVTQELKDRVFERVYPLALEWLEQKMTDDGVSHHITDALKSRPLTAAFGDDLYSWVYDLDA